MRVADSIFKPVTPRPVAAPVARANTVVRGRSLGAGPFGDSSFTPAPLGDAKASALLGLQRNSGTPTQIRQLQDDLMKGGYLADIRKNPGYGNTFGPMTEAAVKRFQSAYGLAQTGRVDAGTVAALGMPPSQPPAPPVTPAPTPGPTYPGAPQGDPNAASLTGMQKGQGTPAQIKQLQDDLAQMGYLDPSIKQNAGYGKSFGPLTEAAVKRFQDDNGLAQTGVVDAATASALASPRPPPAPVAAGAARAYRDQLGLPTGPAQTLADGSVQQSFDHGTVTATKDGMLFVRDPSGADIAPPQKLGVATSVEQANQYFLSQWGPTPFNSAQGAPYGYEDCGPTSVAMTLSSLGLLAHPSPADAEATIDHMRDQALGYDSTRSQGTYDSQLERAITANGGTATVVKPITLDAMDQAIAQGHPLIIGTSATWSAWGKTQSAAGDYLNHQNPGGHYVTVLGKSPDGNYIVGDPLSKIGAVEVTPAQMKVALGGAWDGLEVSRP